MNQIRIDPERVTSDINRNIFGGNMEMGAASFDYLDVGDSSRTDKSNLRSDVRTALERMNLSIIRFPGGNFASGYHWRDGVGPRQERPARYNQAWRRPVSNRYGTNEFIRFCRAMNIEPYLCVNCGDGNMKEAADWVEYCNGTGETALVKLRRKHGFEQPHKVNYWSIGNEVDSPGQIGYKTPQEYARAITEFSKVMKRVDPQIKVIASAVCSWEDHPLGPQFLYRNTEWIERVQQMLEQGGERINYLAIHRYTHTSEDDPFETYMAFNQDLNERLSTFEGLIGAVCMERRIPHGIGIVVDEWGIMRFPAGFRRDTATTIVRDELGVMHLPANSKEPPRRSGRRIINMEDALVTALYLNAFIRHAYSVRMANSLMPMPPSLWANPASPDRPVIMPTVFYPFDLYNRTCKPMSLDVFWSCETTTGSYENRKYSGMRILDVTAALDKNRKQLVVYVVNQSKDKAAETTIALTSGQFTGNAQVSVINGPDLKAENTEEKPDQVGVKESTLQVSGKSFTFTFEPHSVTALVCAVN